MLEDKIVEINPTRLPNATQYGLEDNEIAASLIKSDDPDQELGANTLAGEATGGKVDRNGCLFAPRCSYADGDKCLTQRPPMVDVSEDRSVACHYADTLSLTGFDEIGKRRR